MGELAAALESTPTSSSTFPILRRRPRNLAACAQAGVAVLVGTTGLPADIDAHAAQAARRVPVMIASNTSLGVTC